MNGISCPGYNIKYFGAFIFCPMLVIVRRKNATQRCRIVGRTFSGERVPWCLSQRSGRARADGGARTARNAEILKDSQRPGCGIGPGRFGGHGHEIVELANGEVGEGRSHPCRIVQSCLTLMRERF